jgi:hypothetical protein
MMLPDGWKLSHSGGKASSYIQQAQLNKNQNKQVDLLSQAASKHASLGKLSKADQMLNGSVIGYPRFLRLGTIYVWLSTG